MFLLLCVLSANSQENRVYRFHSGNIQQIGISFPDNSSILIDYCLPDLDLTEVTNNSSRYFRIQVPGHIPSGEPGMPELPVLSRLIAVPGSNSGYSVIIKDVKTIRISPSNKRIRGYLYPAQESEVKAEQRERKFSFNKDAYSSKGFINTDTVRIEYLGKSRDSDLANLFISPVRYDPALNRLQIITSMKIEIRFNGTLEKGTSASKSFLYNETLSKGVINYNREVVPGYTDKPAGMIILTDTSFSSQLKPLILWKTQKGFNVKVLYRGNMFAGTTYTELHDSIKKIYKAANESSPAPDYLLIVGDVNKIPYYGTGGSGNITDMYYGEFDGNGDYIPEMFVGRLPVKDTTELKSVVMKILQYEKFAFDGTNRFYAGALATAGADETYAPYMNGQIRYSVNNYFTNENKLREYHFFYPQDLGKQKDSVLKIINSGVSLINYTGHGDASGWLHLNIRVADTISMKNNSRYPLIISNACRTAQFNLPNSFGNRMVLERNRGAIGFIGCSNDSYWDEDYYWAVGAGIITDNPVYQGKEPGAFDRLFHTHNESPGDWYYTMGQINFAGNLSVSSSSSARKKYYWETYNLVGDPSMIPITGTPDIIHIALPDTLPNGIKSMSLTTDPFAYVAVSRSDKLWDASFAGASGAVTLDLPGVSNDSCLVVVTGQNKYPVIKTVYFSNVTKEYLNLSSATVNDYTGNNNRKADFGESFFLSVNLENLGLTDADETYLKIKSAAAWLSPVTDSAYIGTIPHQSSVSITDKLQIKVSNDVPDLDISTVDLQVRTKNSTKDYKIDLVLHSPDLEILSYVVDDSSTGNGDHIADPGETFYLVFRVINQGSSDASGEFSITTPESGMSILGPGSATGFLRAGQTTDFPLLVRLSGNLSSGNYISVNSELTSSVRSVKKDFVFRIGRIRESFEAKSFEVFPWINNGQIPWVITSTGSFEGINAARSGITPNSGNSSLVIKTYYPLADSLKFYYKVSSEPNYDYLSFTLNGKEILRKSGETGWTKAVVPIPAGLNRMEWKYSKDASVISGMDGAWIDMIDFASSGSVSFIKKDLGLNSVDSPSEKEQYGQEPVRVTVVNSGRDVINGFNLAYSINGKSPVTEHFDLTVSPNNEPVQVIFRNNADLSKYGLYRIAVFGTDNNDDYLLNDTLHIEVNNLNIAGPLTLFPNPFTDHLSVVINSKIEDNASFTIFNAAGKELYKAEKKLLPGKNTILLNDLKFMPGVYYLNVRRRLFSSTIPIVRIKE